MTYAHKFTGMRPEKADQRRQLSFPIYWIGAPIDFQKPHVLCLDRPAFSQIDGFHDVMLAIRSPFANFHDNLAGMQPDEAVPARQADAESAPRISPATL